MKNQFHLLTTRRFIPMFFTQFLGAFNDNLFKQSVVLLFTLYAAHISFASLSTLNNLCAILFILPYFLFSSTAGQLADKFEKTKLTRYLKLIEIAIMVIAALGFIFKLYLLLLAALFLMGTHSAFFGPIKYSILPQLLQDDELVGGNALYEMATSLAILLGMITAGIIYTITHNPYVVSAAIILVAVLGYGAAIFITPQPRNQPTLVIDWNIASTTLQTLRYGYQNHLLWIAILGISWFWYYGATFLTQIPELSKHYLHGTETVITLLLTIFSVGIAIGSLLCERLTKHQISLRISLFASIALSLFAFDLAYLLTQLPSAPLAVQTLTDIIANPAYWHLQFNLLMIGIVGGLYIVPLFAYLQQHAAASYRARVVAANNIMNALFMVVSSIISIIILSALSYSLSVLFALTAIMSLVISVLIYVHIRR